MCSSVIAKDLILKYIPTYCLHPLQHFAWSYTVQYILKNLKIAINLKTKITASVNAVGESRMVVDKLCRLF